MSQQTLCLIRHGETKANRGLWMEDPNLAVLTEVGMAQMESAAAKITSKPSQLILSPLPRVQQSSEPFKRRWPDVPVVIEAIQEFVYLSPQKMMLQTQAARRKCIEAYWARLDPKYLEGPDAESFDGFSRRVQNFYQKMQGINGDTVIIGHGQFIKALLIGHEHGFERTADAMQYFRQEETKHPIKNGEMIQLLVS